MSMLKVEALSHERQALLGIQKDVGSLITYAQRWQSHLHPPVNDAMMTLISAVHRLTIICQGQQLLIEEIQAERLDRIEKERDMI